VKVKMKNQVPGTECAKKHTRPQVLTHKMKQLRMKLRDWPRVAQCVMFVLLALLAPGPSGADADDGAAGDEGREWYSPKVIMSMVEEEPMAPPCTHSRSSSSAGLADGGGEDAAATLM
jgi:hypothetical protein